MLITFLIKLSKYPQNTHTVVAKFNIMLRRLTANEFFWLLAVLGGSFSGKKQPHALLLETRQTLARSPPDTVMGLVYSCQILES